jgi:hypothetical protein
MKRGRGGHDEDGEGDGDDDGDKAIRDREKSYQDALNRVLLLADRIVPAAQQAFYGTTTPNNTNSDTNTTTMMATEAEEGPLPPSLSSSSTSSSSSSSSSSSNSQSYAIPSSGSKAAQEAVVLLLERLDYQVEDIVERSIDEHGIPMIFEDHALPSPLVMARLPLMSSNQILKIRQVLESMGPLQGLSAGLDQLKSEMVKNKATAASRPITANPLVRFASDYIPRFQALTVSTDSKDTPKCAQCQKVTKKLQRCARCQAVRYCSKECQKQHWPQHAPICSVTTSSTSTSSSTTPAAIGGSKSEGSPAISTESSPATSSSSSVRSLSWAIDTGTCLIRTEESGPTNALHLEGNILAVSSATGTYSSLSQIAFTF